MAKLPAVKAPAIFGDVLRAMTRAFGPNDADEDDAGVVEDDAGMEDLTHELHAVETAV